MLVFGESVLNDAVSIVLTRTIIAIGMQSTITTTLMFDVRLLGQKRCARAHGSPSLTHPLALPLPLRSSRNFFSPALARR